MFDHYNMEFHPNKTSAKILREDSFGRTYFRNSYSSVNTKWYNDSLREFSDLLSNTDLRYSGSDYYDVSINKYRAKCGTSLTFQEDKGWIEEIDPYC